MANFQDRLCARACQRAIALLATLACALVAATSAHASPGAFRTGFYDPRSSAGGPGVAYAYLSATLAFAKARSVGTTLVRIPLFWRRVSPAAEPAAGAKDNPGTYNWHRAAGGYNFDEQVQAAEAHGLTPVVMVYQAPAWAECDGQGFKHVSAGGCVPNGKTDRGEWKPSASDYGDFVHALAAQYPELRYFEIWNEANGGYFLAPGRSDATVGRYRELVNSAAAELHAANPANVVIAGSTSPRSTPSTYAPFTFLKKLLNAPVHFDVYSVHPYTQGGPTAAASVASGTTWVGNLKRMHGILVSAARAGKIIVAPHHSLAFWITEFSWDSSPPDCRQWAVPNGLLARWVSEVPYRMWRAGVSALIWAQLKDYPKRWPLTGPVKKRPFQQGGLFSWGGIGRVGAPKLAMRSFRFPFVAFKQRGRVYVWGRTPGGRPGQVVVQRRAGAGWKTVKTLKTNSGGIFSRGFVLKIERKGTMRARMRFSHDASTAFALKAPPARAVLPFGCV